jgi:hypothetical protein
MTAALGQITQILVEAARQEERITALSGRVDRVERAIARPN